MNDKESVELNEALQGMNDSEIDKFIAGIEEIWAKEEAETKEEAPSHSDPTAPEVPE